jgi:hypothetical protein
MNSKSSSIATAVALLLIGGGVVAHAHNQTGTVQVRCFGINSCKERVSAQQPKTPVPGKTPARVGDGSESAAKNVLQRAAAGYPTKKIRKS